MYHRLTGWVAAAFGCAMVLAGCSRSVEQSLKPDAATAQQAIETALTAWKNGQAKPSKLTLGRVGIEIRDPIWNSGQKLKTYQVASEEPQGNSRWFTVKLALAKGEQTAKYAVVGRDPIWIYTEEEYGKLSAWGDDPLHPPAAAVTRRSRGSGGR